ncbi:hypothetical protein [Nocardioides sp. Leaf285]|uniref:hypothetical protein n=1 Tax=Nocardioides sp. Leaf285 TaxID=1736322 RepID=UPI000A578CC7|nr:hypothetical protein [Nocardioides sp. Leaf285]
MTLAPPAEGGLGLTRDEARSLRPTDFRLAPGSITCTAFSRRRAVGTVADPDACPACATVRWLHVAALDYRWSARVVNEYLRRARQRRIHDCGADDPEPPVAAEPGSLPDLDPTWRETPVLAPAIDRYGWTANWRPLTARSLSSIVALRLSHRPDGTSADDAPTGRAPADREAEGAWPIESSSIPTRSRAHLDIDGLFAALDEVAASADAVNARISSLLDDADAFVSTIAGRAPRERLE